MWSWRYKISCSFLWRKINLLLFFYLEWGFYFRSHDKNHNLFLSFYDETLITSFFFLSLFRMLLFMTLQYCIDAGMQLRSGKLRLLFVNGTINALVSLKIWHPKFSVTNWNYETHVHNVLKGGTVRRPSNKRLKMNLYAASVKCKPSQLTFKEGFSQTVDGEIPHSTEELWWYGPFPPQHALSAPLLNPANNNIFYFQIRTND